jgi:hypothetical protein
VTPEKPDPVLLVWAAAAVLVGVLVILLAVM